MVVTLKYVRLDDIEAHLSLGWMVQIEDRPCHHMAYSLVMIWMCECPIPSTNPITTELKAEKRLCLGRPDL